MCARMSKTVPAGTCSSTTRCPSKVGSCKTQPTYALLQQCPAIWVLSTGTLKDLSMVIANSGEGALDNGFTGEGVCGSVPWHTYREKWKAVGAVVSRVINPDPVKFKFGGGSAISRDAYTVCVRPHWSPELVTLTVNVVPGVLPLLLGRVFQARCRMVFDAETGCYYRKVEP